MNVFKYSVRQIKIRLQEERTDSAVCLRLNTMLHFVRFLSCSIFLLLDL